MLFTQRLQGKEAPAISIQLATSLQRDGRIIRCDSQQLRARSDALAAQWVAAIDQFQQQLVPGRPSDSATSQAGRQEAAGSRVAHGVRHERHYSVS